MNYDYAADQLFGIAAILKEFDSLELGMCASTLVNIGAEVRKLAPRVEATEARARLKAEPPRRDSGERVPAATGQPRKPSPSAHA